jgi:hypothetical protein
VEKHWKYSMGPRRTASDESWGRPILGGSAQPVYTLLTCFKHTRINRIYRINRIKEKDNTFDSNCVFQKGAIEH